MKSTDSKFKELQRRIGYVFQNETLLIQAITHRSFSVKKKNQVAIQHNETLEFLGDAVLSLVTAHAVYEKYPQAKEGFLSQLRASYVCEVHLAQAARQMHLGDFILVSPSMSQGGSIDLSSVLSDAVEAIIGAVYLDNGYESAKELVFRLLGALPDKVEEQVKDDKTVLQELVQALCAKTPIYTVLQTVGPAHQPKFSVHVEVNGHVLAQGQGFNKKEAAQDAARKALDFISQIDQEELKLKLLQE